MLDARQSTKLERPSNECMQATLSSRKDVSVRGSLAKRVDHSLWWISDDRAERRDSTKERVQAARRKTVRSKFEKAAMQPGFVGVMVKHL